MSYFPDTWKNLARDPWGEAASVRLTVRTNDLAPELVVVTDAEAPLSFNPVRRERERKFGVVQGQAWQVQTTNMTLLSRSKELVGAWARLEVGFKGAAEWETLAVGKVQAVTIDSNATMTLEVGDPLAHLMEATLKRDTFFGTSGWASTIQRESVSDTSRGYENDWDGDGEDEGVEVTLGVALSHETIILEFTDPTTFKVILLWIDRRP